jgi:hypothetical protein
MYDIAGSDQSGIDESLNPFNQDNNTCAED